MEVSLRLVVSLMIGVVVLLALSALANNYINSSEQALIGWLP